MGSRTSKGISAASESSPHVMLIPIVPGPTALAATSNVRRLDSPAASETPDRNNLSVTIARLVRARHVERRTRVRMSPGVSRRGGRAFEYRVTDHGRRELAQALAGYLDDRQPPPIKARSPVMPGHFWWRDRWRKR